MLFMMLSLAASSQIIFVDGDDMSRRKAAEPNAEVQQRLKEATTLGMYTENFTEMYVPINGGLVFLTLGAFAYLARKKMKKAMALALVCLAIMCSCSKEEIITPQQKVHVSFENTRGPSNSRMTIDEYGIVKFEEDDIVYMYAGGVGATQGRYLGSLAYNPSQLKFIGDVNDWHTGEQLYFYYMGDNVANTTGATEIDLSDQSYTGDDLDHIAHSFFVSCYETTALNEVDKDFYGQLKNLIAIAAFNTQEFNDGTNVKILSSNRNLKNVIKINADGSLEYCVAGINNDPAVDEQSGHIVIGHASSMKYVALLPISKSTPANCNLVFTSNGKASASSLSIPIAVNTLWYASPAHDPICVHATNCNSTNYIEYPSPEDCIASPYLFTTAKENHNGVMVTKKVVFSQGNLVYDHGRFKQHKNPWETCTITSNADINANGEFDVFGWATSGFNYNQHIFQPYSNSTTQYGGSIGYGYGATASGYKQSFFPDKNYRRSDWGWHQFVMGVYPEYQMTIGKSYWRTLGQVEWTYIFYNRAVSSTGLVDYATSTNVANGRFAKCTLCGVTGVLLFPDTYTHPSSIHLSYINADGANGYTANILSESDFNTLHEAGVEFFPINGYWDKTTETFVDPTLGYYWSCKTQKTDQAIICKMTDKASGSIYTTHINKYQGLYVRLVFQVDGEIY